MQSSTLNVFNGVAALASRLVTWRHARSPDLVPARPGMAGLRAPSLAVGESGGNNDPGPVAFTVRDDEPRVPAREPFLTIHDLLPSAPVGVKQDRAALQMSALEPAPATDGPPVQAELFDDSDSIEHIDLFEPEQNSALFIGTVNVGPPPAAPQAPGPAPRPGITTAAHNLPSSRRPPIETRTPQALADDFIQWLRESLACGSLAVNTVHSAVHFCDEGMLLICPAIFQTYVATCTPPAPATGAPARSAPVERDKVVMQAVCSLGWHVRGVLDSSQLHFQWLQQRGVAPILLKGMLLPQPERLLDFVPPSNPALSRLT